MVTFVYLLLVYLSNPANVAGFLSRAGLHAFITADFEGRPNTDFWQIQSAGQQCLRTRPPQPTAVPVPQVAGITPSSGDTQGGTRVFLNGSGLKGPIAVHFGANPAPYSSADSDAQITTTSPPGTGVVTVTVTTSVVPQCGRRGRQWKNPPRFGMISALHRRRLHPAMMCSSPLGILHQPPNNSHVADYRPAATFKLALRRTHEQQTHQNHHRRIWRQ